MKIEIELKPESARRIGVVAATAIYIAAVFRSRTHRGETNKLFQLLYKVRALGASISEWLICTTHYLTRILAVMRSNSLTGNSAGFVFADSETGCFT